MAVLTYSPSHVDPLVLERLTIGMSRHQLLETLVGAVRSEVGRDAHQHHLLIGPRGSGKTHILTLTAHRLRTDSELGSRTLPLVLAEEVVASHPADLMRRVLAKLSELLDGMAATGVPAARRGAGAALAALRSEPDDDRALEIAMGALEEASEALGLLLVPIVENLNLLLYSGPGLSRRSEMPGQWALRRALLEAHGVLLVAASPTLFGEVCDPQAPFYDFFRLHRLEELHPEEMLELIRTRLELELEGDGFDTSRRARLLALSDHFEERTPKLRGLLTLTGGLPRFAHLLFDLLAETDVPRIVDLLAQFLDKQTPYFQPYLDPRMHPEAELEVLDRLASAEGPLTPREIASGLRAGSVNAVSTYLKRLRVKGLIRQLGASRKDIRYDLTEPLFRVWRRFRLGRNEREQVVLIAEFIAAMFEPSQLQTEWSQLEGVETAAFRRRVLEAALARQGWQPALGSHALLTEKGSQLAVALKEAKEEFFHGSLQKAYELFSRVVEALRDEEGDQIPSLILAEFSIVALMANRPEHALALAKQAEEQAQEIGDDLGQASAILSRGIILSRLDQNQAALQVLNDAEPLYQKLSDELGKAHTFYHRGVTLFQLGQHQDALQALNGAEAIYQKLDNELGVGACRCVYGRVASVEGRFYEGMDHLVTAYHIARKLGHLTNAALARPEVWSLLLRAAHELPNGQFQQLLRKAEPLLQHAVDDEAVRNELVVYAIVVLVLFGPERLLETLPVLEDGLPASQATLMRPARLAAEIQAGQRSAELPEETDEIRRAVLQVQERVEKLRRDISGSSNVAPKQRARRGKRKNQTTA